MNHHQRSTKYYIDPKKISYRMMIDCQILLSYYYYYVFISVLYLQKKTMLNAPLLIDPNYNPNVSSIVYHHHAITQLLEEEEKCIFLS